MMLRSFLAIIGLALVSQPSSGMNYEDLSSMRSAVHEHVSEHYRQNYDDSALGQDIKVKVGNLDSRLKLVKCSKPLEFDIIMPKHVSRNLTVKTGCRGDQFWTIYIPVSVDIYTEIIVASRSLARGQVVEDSDISYQRMNISRTGVGFISDPDRIKGMELKRSVKAGEPLRLSYIGPTNVIKKGDAVVVVARMSNLSVEAPGTALSNGYIGQQIKVKNTQSKRIIDALVTGPGEVSVTYRRGENLLSSAD